MASNITYTQFILQQQQYITQQQHFLEKLMLDNNQDKKLKQLEDEVKVLKMKIQYLTSHLNKQNATCINQIKVLKKESSLMKEKMDKLFSEISLIEETSQMMENLPNQSLDAVGGEVNAGDAEVNAGEESANPGEMDQI